jgi:hypothetical protein
MVTEPLSTESDAEVISEQWEGKPIVPFADKAHTKAQPVRLIIFPTHRFMSQDDEEAERWLVLSMEAFEGEW